MCATCFEGRNHLEPLSASPRFSRATWRFSRHMAGSGTKSFPVPILQCLISNTLEKHCSEDQTAAANLLSILSVPVQLPLPLSAHFQLQVCSFNNFRDHTHLKPVKPGTPALLSPATLGVAAGGMAHPQQQF